MAEPMHDHPGHQRIGRWELPIAALSAALLIELVFLAQVFFVIPAKFFAAILPGVIVDATNAERGTESFGALATNPLLQAAAQKKADDMAAKGYFAHVAPDGTEPWFWFKLIGYGYAYAGENLAVNFADSKDVVDAWMRSPSHRANIMNGNYTEIGVGVAEGEYQGQRAVYVVQFFGRPAVAFAASAPQLPTSDGTSEVVAPQRISEPAPTPASAGTSEVAAAQTEAAKPKPVRLKPVSLPFPPAPSAPAEPASMLGSEPIDPTFVAVPGTPETFPAAPTVIPTSPARESTVVGQLLASPRATSNAMLLVLMTALAAALLLAGATLEHAHLSHALAGGTLALLVVVSFLAINHATVLAAVQVK